MMESSNFDDVKNISNFTWGEFDDKGMDTFDPNLIELDDFYQHSKGIGSDNSVQHMHTSFNSISSSHDAPLITPTKTHNHVVTDDLLTISAQLILSPESSFTTAELSPPQRSDALLDIDLGHENEYHQESLTIEQIYDELQLSLDSPTDPVGKFLRKWNLSVCDVIRLNIHEILMQAPRKPREKYGKRKDVSAAERVMVCRERNREHAKSTRVRKRIFREIETMLKEHQCGSSSSDQLRYTTK